ncbi:reverse transcriptase/maturase family protein [Mesorhizobium sp. M0306]|uniref:reverse transcriptase domain-containing protein n=1 Tax=Mesorhizobium sp. M0306 TaxID=2956932 RepID=UPI00333BC195
MRSTSWGSPTVSGRGGAPTWRLTPCIQRHEPACELGLDADIRSFFDAVDHEWLLRMVAHRIADPRILRFIGLWVRAGVLESDEKQETDRGTPQGAGISPLLANMFLRYILDLWAHQWRRSPCTRSRCDRALR